MESLVSLQTGPFKQAPFRTIEYTPVHSDHWKLNVQQIIDRIVERYVRLDRHTGLQLLVAIGEEWRYRDPYFRKEETEQLITRVTVQLLKTLTHIIWTHENIGFISRDMIGHHTLSQEGRHQIHLYLLDETIPTLDHVYRWYLKTHATDSMALIDDVVIHFLLEEKEVVFSVPNKYSSH